MTLTFPVPPASLTLIDADGIELEETAGDHDDECEDFIGDNHNSNHVSDDFHGDDKHDYFYDDNHFHGDADYVNADNGD